MFVKSHPDTSAAANKKFQSSCRDGVSGVD